MCLQLFQGSHSHFSLLLFFSSYHALPWNHPTTLIYANIYFFDIKQHISPFVYSVQQKSPNNNLWHVLKWHRKGALGRKQSSHWCVVTNFRNLSGSFVMCPVWLKREKHIIWHWLYSCSAKEEFVHTQVCDNRLNITGQCLLCALGNILIRTEQKTRSKAKIKHNNCWGQTW